MLLANQFACVFTCICVLCKQDKRINIYHLSFSFPLSLACNIPAPRLFFLYMRIGVQPWAFLIFCFCVFSWDWQAALSLEHCSINLFNMLQKHSSARTGSRGNGIAAGKSRLAYLMTGDWAGEAQESSERSLKPSLLQLLGTSYQKIRRWTISDLSHIVSSIVLVTLFLHN